MYANPFNPDGTFVATRLVKQNVAAPIESRRSQSTRLAREN